jgi:hypothetical protein
MSHRRPSQPQTPGSKAGAVSPKVSATRTSSERLEAFLAFWLVAALVLFGLGVATLAAVDRGRRLAAFFIFLAAVCLAIAYLVQRARRLA